MLLVRSEFTSWLLSLESNIVVGVFIEEEAYEIYVHPFSIYLQKISNLKDWRIGGNFYFAYHDGFECNKEIMDSWATVFNTRVLAKRLEDQNVVLVSAGEALKLLDEVDQFLVSKKIS